MTGDRFAREEQILLPSTCVHRKNLVVFRNADFDAL